MCNLFLKKIYYHIYFIIVGEDLENNDVGTRDERAEPNKIIVRHYLFSQFVPLQALLVNTFLCYDTGL